RSSPRLPRRSFPTRRSSDLPRRIEDRGGGLARVDGRARLVESLALPREEDEFNLSYYNSLTTWIDIDQLLQTFGLVRADLDDAADRKSTRLNSVTWPSRMPS